MAPDNVQENSQSGEPNSQAQSQFARRGGRSLSLDEFEAHLAALIRLENIGVLLGAGTSTGELGGKTMIDLWKVFKDSYQESSSWLINNNFVVAGENPNIERLLDTIDVALTEWKRLKWTRRFNQLHRTQSDIYRALLVTSLLKREWWENPHLEEPTRLELSNHRTLLQRLTASRQPGQPAPWIFTTNYDLAIEWSAESIGLRVTNGFEGLHYRTFSPHSFDLGFRNMLARGEARFGTYGFYLAKLHGSLNWRLTPDELSFVELSIEAAWPKIRSFIENVQKTNFDYPLVYPNSAKYAQTVGFVLGELLRRYTDFLSRPQTGLITLGYSFSDSHLNLILARALQNPTLQLVICLPEANISKESIDLSNCDRWVRQIAQIDSPQVTIVGNGNKAWLESFVKHLPDPAIYDEQAHKIRDLLKELKSPDES